jgi:hypothetical protein
LTELQSVSKEVQMEEKSALLAEWYPLFSNTGMYRRTAFDPVEVSLPDLRRLYEKRVLDANYVDPYFSRLATGVLPLSGFSQMREQWLMDHGSDELNLTSGRDLMNLFSSWYLAKTDTK